MLVASIRVRMRKIRLTVDPVAAGLGGELEARRWS